jgi:hypothetical protein
MRPVFAILLVLIGVVGSAALSRLMPRAERDAGLAGGARLLRAVALFLVPMGVLVILSSGIRMIGAGQVGMALLFGAVGRQAPAALRRRLRQWAGHPLQHADAGGSGSSSGKL